MDFPKVVELINQLLAAIKPGLSIPDTVTDEAGLELAMGIVLPSLEKRHLPADVVAMSLRGQRRRIPTRATKAQGSDTATLLRSIGMTEEAISRQRKRFGF